MKLDKNWFLDVFTLLKNKSIRLSNINRRKGSTNYVALCKRPFALRSILSLRHSSDACALVVRYLK